MTSFTPVSAAIGGLMIGTAASLLWLGLGRIAGISGILAASPRALQGTEPWRLAFLAGLLAAGPVWLALGGAAPAITVTASPVVLIAGGLLVGFGTRLGGGCTSGHGVCGLARLSGRSITATLLFLATAVATVFVVRHLGALS